jgi:hypothetical protein
VLKSYSLLKSLLQRCTKFEKRGTIVLQQDEVQRLRNSTKYKEQAGRNMLGVRVLLEDWIHGLEIGHVMQLNPMLPSEL